MEERLPAAKGDPIKEPHPWSHILYDLNHSDLGHGDVVMDQLLVRTVGTAVVTARHNQVHAELSGEIDKAQPVHPHYRELGLQLPV